MAEWRLACEPDADLVPFEDEFDDDDFDDDDLIPLPNNCEPDLCPPFVSFRAAFTGITYWCWEGEPGSTCTPLSANAVLGRSTPMSAARAAVPARMRSEASEGGWLSLSDGGRLTESRGRIRRQGRDLGVERIEFMGTFIKRPGRREVVQSHLKIT